VQHPCCCARRRGQRFVCVVSQGWQSHDAAQVKLSVRLPRTASSRQDHNARAAGLSRGVYLARLIDGAPPVVASSDRAAMFNALNASSAELNMPMMTKTVAVQRDRPSEPPERAREPPRERVQTDA
jgi:hypothetical protein